MTHEFYSARRHSIAFSLSTKDRVELTREMLPPFLEEGDYDLFWMDGSSSVEGKRLPFEVQNQCKKIREIHTDVFGGPDGVIVRALSRMLECGYDYCGLIENDIKLKPGWFSNLLWLFEQGHKAGLRVGAVGSRSTFKHLALACGAFAIAQTVGAAMILLSRQAVEIILNTYRTANWYDIFTAFAYGSGISLNEKLGPRPTSELISGLRTADWWFDSALQLHGYCSLFPAPSMAANTDPGGKQHYAGDYVQGELTVTAQDREALEALKHRQFQIANNEQHNLISRSKVFLFNPLLAKYIVFPHQALAMGGCTLTGDWKLKWCSAWGPFHFVTASSTATLRLTFIADSIDLCLMSGPQSGPILVKSGGEALLRVDLLRPNEELVNVTMTLPFLNEWELVVQLDHVDPAVASPKFLHWTGIAVKDVQPWFSARTGFGFSIIQPYV